MHGFQQQRVTQSDVGSRENRLAAGWRWGRGGGTGKGSQAESGGCKGPEVGASLACWGVVRNGGESEMKRGHTSNQAGRHRQGEEFGVYAKCSEKSWEEAKERFHLINVFGRSLAAEETWSRHLTYKVKNKSQGPRLGGAVGGGRGAQVGIYLAERVPRTHRLLRGGSGVRMMPAGWSWGAPPLPPPPRLKAEHDLGEAWG